MSQLKQGDSVKVHYTGTLADGSVFDSSEGREPLEFTFGAGQVIPGLEAGMEGMSVGEKRVVEVPADQAYGPVHSEARRAVPRGTIRTLTLSGQAQRPQILARTLFDRITISETQNAHSDDYSTRR